MGSASPAGGREHLGGRVLERRREAVDSQVEQLAAADPGHRAHRYDGVEARAGHGLLEVLGEGLVGDLLAAEVAVHEGLVLGLLDDSLDEGSAEVVVRTVVDHQVEQPCHVLAVAYRDVEGEHLLAERLPGGSQYAVVVGARVVELGDHHGAWHPDLGALAPQGGGGVVDGLVGADHEQRAVGGPQAGAHLTDEVGVAGGVDEVDLGLPMDHRRDRQRDRAFVGVLELLEVADGAALGDGSRSGDGSGGGEQRLDQGGLPGPTGSDQHHVADPVGAARPEILPGWSATACPVSHLRLRSRAARGEPPVHARHTHQ